MRRLLATDLGIWPRALNQQLSSDDLYNNTDCWAAIAEYLLLYDQIVVPTGNFQILAVFRLVLGEAVFDELVRTRVIVLIRYDQWFGYIGGGGGVGFFKVLDNPNVAREIPNLATMHFKPAEQAIADALKILNPPSTVQRREAIRKAVMDSLIELPTEHVLVGVRDEAYRDIEGSPYLRELLGLDHGSRSIDNLPDVKESTVYMFNPQVPAEKNDPRAARAVLRVVFENFLLSMTSHTQSTELTGDAGTLSILQAKGQRLGFAPLGRQAFAQLQRVHGVPDLGAAFAAKQISSEQILALRSSKHTQALRDWLAEGSPGDSAEDTLARYIETIGKPAPIDRLPIKALRFGMVKGWGMLEPVSGTAASIANSFLLSKWFPAKSPKLFMKQAKVMLGNSPVVKPPIQKGRHRNDPCICGSGNKYKLCCGRLS